MSCSSAKAKWRVISLTRTLRSSQTPLHFWLNEILLLVPRRELRDVTDGERHVSLLPSPPTNHVPASIHLQRTANASLMTRNPASRNLFSDLSKRSARFADPQVDVAAFKTSILDCGDNVRKKEATPQRERRPKERHPLHPSLCPVRLHTNTEGRPRKSPLSRGQTLASFPHIACIAM